MDASITLHETLAAHASRGGLADAVATTVECLAGAARDMSDFVGLGPLGGVVGATLGRNAGGDHQKDLDVAANRLFREALRAAPVAAFASEEEEAIARLDLSAPLAVAVDPVDGSGNIALNMPIGTIFSIMPRLAEDEIWPSGRRQLAAGFVVYGPQTSLVLSLGAGVDVFTLDRRRGVWVLGAQRLAVPAEGPDEYAVNASNYRHWEEPIRSFVDECIAGSEGRFGRDFNMRWHGALVAEANRILLRGGIYLYPADARQGYGSGRLRLIYEAYPIAFLMEQAGGAASSGRMPILDVEAVQPHMRVPLIFGSAGPVRAIETLHVHPELWPATPPPLFASRSLFRI